MSETRSELIGELFAAKRATQPSASMADWFASFNDSTRHQRCSVVRAILGGRQSPTVAHAFAAGYQSAVEALFQMETPELASLCVSETGGNHPRVIETSLNNEDGRLFLNGRKQFVSGAKDAQVLFVAATTGSSDTGLPQLKVVRVRNGQPGLDIQEMPPLGFVPEMPHGRVTFDALEVDAADVLPGDGYLNYIKPFRSVEDLHVMAALSAYRFGEAIDSGWDREACAKHIPLLLSLTSLANSDWSSASLHLSLFACREQLLRLLETTDPLYEQFNPEGFTNWKRDRKLLSIASQAHAKRTDNAWHSLQALKP